jgi:AcrR family transcriptional regulator
LPRAQQVAKNREDLLAAADEVFRELGYSRASLDAIAERAGFSKGAVYSHFASKADLFLTLLETRIEARARGQLAVVERATQDEAALEYIEQVFSFTREDPRWPLAVLEFRVVAARDAELAARYARAHRRALECVAASLAALFESLGVQPEVSLDTLAVAGMIFDVGSCLEDVVFPGSVSPHAAAVLFARLLGIPLTAAGGTGA